MFASQKVSCFKGKCTFSSRQGTEILLKSHLRKLLQGEICLSRRVSFPPLTAKGPQIWTLHLTKVERTSSHDSATPKHSPCAWNRTEPVSHLKTLLYDLKPCFKTHSSCCLIIQSTELNQNLKGHFKIPHFPTTQLRQELL